MLQDFDLDRRFAGLDRLYGVSAALRVRDAHVVVVGVGGVGSWAAEALARSGVGTITLIDMDHVAESNVNRQVHAITPTIGQSKIVAMQERIFNINPSCTVNCVDDFVTPENWLSVVPPGVDAVIDACDQVKAKVAMAVWAKRNKSCFITVGAAGGKRLAHGVDIADLSVVTHDPLLAQMRYQLRKHHGHARDGKKIGLNCVFSKEAVKPADASCAVGGDGTLNCHGYGSMVSVTATFGLCAAGWVIDKISQTSAKLVKSNAII